MKVKNRACIRRLSFKALWAQRRRNLIAVLAIALTTLLFTSLFTIALSINESYQDYTFRQIGGYNHGTFKDVDQEKIEAISAHKKVKETGVRKVIGTITEGVFAKLPAEISYMDKNCTKWSYAQPTTGRMPESGKEISMDTGSLQLLGIEPKLGAEIALTFQVGDKDQLSYEKTDIFTLVGFWDYEEISPVHYLNVSKEYVEQVEAEGIAAGMNPFRCDLNVMMASSLDIRGQMEQVDLDLGYEWETRDADNSVRIGVNWGYTSAQLDQQMDVTTMVAIIAFLALVIFTGYLIIYNIFQISVTGDIRFYGLLKTIGTTPRQLRRIIRLQALFLCVAGIPCGLAAGYMVGAVLTPVILGRISLEISAVSISASPVIFIAAALFSLLTVLLSCFKPGRMAARVSPVEACKYTENIQSKKKSRVTRGAKLYQMAYANLGRNRAKTALVILSLSLSVVLFHMLVLFTGGFNMEKYLEKNACADFIFGSTDYFRFQYDTDLPDALLEDIAANTEQTLAGCGYRPGVDVIGWIEEDVMRGELMRFVGDEAMVEASLAAYPKKNGLLGENILIEGVDAELLDKVEVVDGDLAPLFDPEANAIAIDAEVDDYGNVVNADSLPAIGEEITVTYLEEAYFVDSRTGEKADDATPEEYLKQHIEKSRDVSYTVCAHVKIPYSMSYRYSRMGYSALMLADTLKAHSGQELERLFYLFDTPDSQAEMAAEEYLAQLTQGETSGLMYESKAILRKNFQSFRSMFLLLGGLLCAIIGIVGILNFFNAIMTGILSRRREFAVLQAVGMTNRQLKTMLIYEGLFYAMGAALTALALSLAVTPLAGRLLETMFWFCDVNFTLWPVLSLFPVFVLLGWLIPALMYRQAARHSVVERLRESE